MRISYFSIVRLAARGALRRERARVAKLPSRLNSSTRLMRLRRDRGAFLRRNPHGVERAPNEEQPDGQEGDADERRDVGPAALMRAIAELNGNFHRQEAEQRR